MGCYYPKYATQDETPNENGKRPLSFAFKGSQLDNTHTIPCGKCLGCSADRRRDWGIRIYHESLCHERNCMVTLTYDEEHIPIDHKLHKPDVQKFIKRLRKRQKVRYFAVGEYGEKTHRPHYHICIFGEDFRAISNSHGDGMYTNHELDRTWALGQARAIQLQPSSAMYTAGYVTKKQHDADTFNIMSKSPPLGKEWVMQNARHLENRDKTVIQGVEMPWPQVYFDWVQELDFHKANYTKPDRTLEVLRNREKNHQAKHNLLKEKI